MAQYALCMGVSDYSAWRALGWNAPDLPYSLKNAEVVAHLLVDRFGFDTANIGVQRDAWCNAGTVLNALHDLLATKAQPGDVVCVFFSGHGTRLQGVGQDGRPTPALWYDAIVPHTGSPLTDFDLQALAGSFDAAHVSLTFVVDAGFTGGVTAVTGAPQPSGIPIPGDQQALFAQSCRTLVPFGLCLSQPADALGGNIRGVLVDNGRVAIDEIAEKSVTDAARSLLVTACGADQLGWQADALQGSVFVSALQNTAQGATSPSTNADLLASLRAETQRLMAKHVGVIASYARQASAPRISGGRPR